MSSGATAHRSSCNGAATPGVTWQHFSHRISTRVRHLRCAAVVSHLGRPYRQDAARVFRHAASTGACSAVLAGSIQGNRQYALESLPYARGWEDVRRVIATASGDTEHDIRDRDIAVAGCLRSSPRRSRIPSARSDRPRRAAAYLAPQTLPTPNLPARAVRGGRLSGDTSTTFDRTWRTPRYSSEHKRPEYPSATAIYTIAADDCARTRYRGRSPRASRAAPFRRSQAAGRWTDPQGDW